jgi:hypothetical protein
LVLTSNDIRIGFILAIVEDGDIEDKDNPFTDIFNAGLIKYIEDTIVIYNDISPEEISDALEKWYDTEPEARSLTSRWKGDDWEATGYESDFNIVVSAQIKTEWNQFKPYNEYVNIERTAAQGAPNTSNGYLAGCGPVAAAQLIAYYGYLSNTYYKPNNFNSNYNYFLNTTVFTESGNSFSITYKNSSKS